MTYEKICLKWNDFEQNIISNYSDFRKESEYSDVTLVCEEDHQIEAHRIILTACSPFFNTVLKRNKHAHPIIYMRGLKAKDLVAIVDFIYLGEANIIQEDLNGFLALAEELQLKGMSGSQDEANAAIAERIKNLGESPIKVKRKLTKDKECDNVNKSSFEDYSVVPVEGNKIVVANTTADALKVQRDSMMEIIDNVEYKLKCTVCGKETKGRNARKILRCHIETHMEGLSYPCNQCDKVCKSSNTLSLHLSSYHKK